MVACPPTPGGQAGEGPDRDLADRQAGSWTHGVHHVGSLYQLFSAGTNVDIPKSQTRKMVTWYPTTGQKMTPGPVSMFVNPQYRSGA